VRPLSTAPANRTTSLTDVPIPCCGITVRLHRVWGTLSTEPEMRHPTFVPMTLRLIVAALCDRKGEAAERCKKSSENASSRTTAMKVAMVAIRHSRSASGAHS
jgi:hypothetical protein